MKRNEWIEQAKSKLDEWNERMSALEHEAKAEYHDTLAKARTHVSKATAQVARAGSVGSDAWAESSETLQKAWNDEKEIIEDALGTLTA